MKIRLALPLSMLVAATLAACSDGSGGKKGPCDLDVARYEGYATDETCVTMHDAEDAGSITMGGANAPVLVSPTNGATVVASSGLTITFDTPLDLDLVTAPRKRGSALASIAPLFFAGDAIAHAHEPPVTGAIHRLRFTGIGGSDEPIDVYTSKLNYPLDDELLAELEATSGTITLELTSMYVTQNLINNASTDGPFRMTPNATFTIP